MPKFRTITGQFAGYIPDGTDPDIVPDRTPMNGKVTFTPVFTGGVIAFPELSPPEFARPEPIRARIVDGFVRVEVGVDETLTLQPLSLMVTVDDEASQVWSWRAEFDEILIGASDEYVNIPAWSFRVPDGTGPVDLTELVPLKTSGTVDVTKGPRGAGLQTITAVDGQLVFAYSDGQESTVPIPEAVQGPQGEPGPAGADGAQGPEGPQGPAGEIPDLLVSNISDATPTGKNLMLAATEGAARSALGLAAGATAGAGPYSELAAGTSSVPRVWSANSIATYTNSKVDAAKTAYSARDYGAVGDGVTDDTAAIQATVAAAAAAGVVAQIPIGRYKLTGTIDLTSGASLKMDSGTILDMSNVPYSVPAIRAEGTVDAALTLTVDAAKGTREITVADSTSIMAGDWVKVSSTLAYGYTGQPTGEIQRVASSSEGIITVDDALYDTYRAAENAIVEKVNFVEDVSISGGTIAGGSDSTVAHQGITIDRARGVSISGVQFRQAHYSGIYTKDCVSVSITGCSFDEALHSGTGYGILLTWATQDAAISACTATRVRHMLTMGGASSRGGVIRRVTVTGCTASQCLDAAIDAHPGAEDYVFSGNSVSGSEFDGIVSQGARFVISNNVVTDSVRHGIIAQGATRGGLGGTISGNVVTNSGGDGIKITVRTEPAYQVWHGVAISGNTVENTALYGISLVNSNTSIVVEALSITGNTVRNATLHGVYVQGVKGALVGSNFVGPVGATMECVFLHTSPGSAISGNVANGGLRAYRLSGSTNVTVTGNVGASNGNALLTNTGCAPTVVMGNNFSGSTQGISLAGSGNISSSADSSGAYNV